MSVGHSVVEIPMMKNSSVPTLITNDEFGSHRDAQ